MAEHDGDDIEQTAIEIKVLEFEQALVGKAAGVIGDDQFAVVMLDAFVVGDRVVLEGAERDDNKRGDQGQGRDVIGIGARRSSDLPAPAQCVLHAAGNALPTWLRFGHYHLAPCTVPAATSPKSPEKFRLMDAS